MSDWVARGATGNRVIEWIHVPTGVVLSVRAAADGHAVYIQATDSGSVDRVSIGDPDTGQFRTFDERERAVKWADEWKDSETVLEALEAADPESDTIQ